MRPLSIPSLLACAVLVGCSANPTVDEWTRVQRERLERARSQRSDKEALAEVLAAAPRLQDPRYIDQREPQGPGGGVRPYRALPQPLTVSASFGAGEVKAKGKGTLLNDRTDTKVIGVKIDSGTGAALHADLWQSNTELFRGTRINDGIEPARADARLSGIDIYPHVRLDTWRGDFTMPLRLGMFGEWQSLEHDFARVQRDFLSLGPRVVVEPTLRVLGDRDASLSLWTRVGGDVGIAWFDEQYRNGDDGDRTVRWGGELGGGLRGQLDAFSADIGWRWNQAWFGDTDTDLYGDRSRTELHRQQVFLGFGVTF
jgi:hypothetical protein